MALGVSNLQAPNQAGSDLSELGIPMNTGNHLGQSITQTSSLSWRDPQIFLESAASGKSVPTHHDLTDFVNNSVEEEVVCLFVCVEVLRPSQPNGVMSSVVSLPNHTFTGQA